jgi:DNA-binding response OmpR family regulator
VLQWLRQHSELKRLVVVVLTASQEHTDIHRAYELGANSYLVKPINIEALIDLVKLVDNYWFKTNLNCHTFEY